MAHHNTICHAICKKVCHNRCGLPFEGDSTKLEACMINNDGRCKECGCGTKKHIHARMEYFMAEQLTDAYIQLEASVADLERTKTDINEKVDNYRIKLD